MKLEAEVLSPHPYFAPSTCLIQNGKQPAEWTPQENKLFENALALVDGETPDKWERVAAMLPGKTVGDVMRQYKRLVADVSDIEAGLVPIPGYNPSAFTLDWGKGGYHGYDAFRQGSYGGACGKRGSSGRSVEQERKKGVPWTEEEHRLFLMGLEKHGKGDWRSISRNYVITRTPTQVASHAQKYFIRQHSGGKDKRRASIHDITMVNLNDTRTFPSPDSKGPPSPDHSKFVSLRHHEATDMAAMSRTQLKWNQLSAASTMAFVSPDGNILMASPFGMNSYEDRMQGPFESFMTASQTMNFQTPSAHFE